MFFRDVLHRGRCIDVHEDEFTYWRKYEKAAKVRK